MGELKRKNQILRLAVPECGGCLEPRDLFIWV